MKLNKMRNFLISAALSALAVGGCKSDDTKPGPAGSPDSGTIAAGGTGGANAGGADAGPRPDAGVLSTDTAGRSDVGTTTTDGSVVVAMAPPASTCQIATDKKVAVSAAAGRSIYCGIDIGSNSVKLIVLSIEKMGTTLKPESTRDERQCRRTLGLGAKSYDQATMKGKTLGATDIAYLIETIKEFQDICKLDKGAMGAADATQWARDAVNIDEVKTQVKAETSLEVDVFSPEKEGYYGYISATRNKPKFFSIDPGSNSFQLAFWADGDKEPKSVSVPFGYVRGAAMFFANDLIKDYKTARDMYATYVKKELDTALGKLTPATSLAMLKASVGTKLNDVIFGVGQDGAVHLAVGGQLNAGGVWIPNKAMYDARVAMEKPMDDATYVQITKILKPMEITTFNDGVKATDFATLRTGDVRVAYGEKVLCNTVLLETLANELGVKSVVLVPAEMPNGYIIANAK